MQNGLIMHYEIENTLSMRWEMLNMVCRNLLRPVSEFHRVRIAIYFMIGRVKSSHATPNYCYQY